MSEAAANNLEKLDVEDKADFVFPEELQFTVLYRFNEGYTNAVKKPLLMRDLL
jgi:hypothetical protein